MSGDIKKLIEMLRRHDWTYEYADDPSAWRRGRESSKAIQEEARKLGSDGAYIVEQASIEQKAGNLIEWLALVQAIGELVMQHDRRGSFYSNCSASD
tara:strand:+ start:1497 stop:1787 length:291 start_codon:yes stop_codon:yes gene_type:complete